MGSTTSGETDQSWVWLGALGLLGLIIGIIMLFAMEKKTPGAIVTVISLIILLLAAFMWWGSLRNTQVNDF